MGHIKCLNVLVSLGANIHTYRRRYKGSYEHVNDSTVLMHAAAHGQAEFVKELIVMGADVNYHSKEGMSALYIAARDGYESVVDVLLTVPNLNLDMMTLDGQTAIKVSRDNGHHECSIKLLDEMRRRADVSGDLIKKPK